ncbi:hypothetical protein [Microcystis phage Mwe-JY26]
MSITPEQQEAINEIAARIEANPRLRSAVRQAQHEARMQRLGKLGCVFRQEDEVWKFRLIRYDMWSEGATSIEFAALEAEQLARERGLI